jgi:hypothetical protein
MMEIFKKLFLLTIFLREYKILVNYFLIYSMLWIFITQAKKITI